MNYWWLQRVKGVSVHVWAYIWRAELNSNFCPPHTAVWLYPLVHKSTPATFNTPVTYMNCKFTSPAGQTSIFILKVRTPKSSVCILHILNCMHTAGSVGISRVLHSYPVDCSFCHCQILAGMVGCEHLLAGAICPCVSVTLLESVHIGPSATMLWHIVLHFAPFSRELWMTLYNQFQETSVWLKEAPQACAMTTEVDKNHIQVTNSHRT